MAKSIIQEMSFAFAVQIVRFCRNLYTNHKEFVLSRQLLRSGTSIGANVEEALGGQSKKDFLAKMYVAGKEARETLYWLRLLRESDIIPTPQIHDLLVACQEIVKVLSSITLTTRQNLRDAARSSSIHSRNSKLLTPHSKLPSRGSL